MHASIALYVMFLGGVMVPESEITTISLMDDLSKVTAIQDQEYQERLKRQHLPRIPSLDDRQQAGDNAGPYRKDFYPPNDPKAGQSKLSQIMPLAPTDPSGGNGPTSGYTPGRLGQQGGVGQQGFSPKNDPYGNASAGRNPVSGYSAGTGYAPRATPSVSNYIDNTRNSVNGYVNQYGPGAGSSYPAGGTSTGKAFDNYQSPNGFSPWQLLNQPTQNGTLNPYTAYVQPVVNQQNTNQRFSEQINGVQTMQRMGDSGTPGMEVQGAGAGLVNPGAQIDYTIH